MAWRRRRSVPSPKCSGSLWTNLVREVGAQSWSIPLDGSTLAELAGFAGTSLLTAFSAGPNTPPVGATDQPLHLSSGELDTYYDWFDLGWRVLDDALCSRGDPGPNSTIQLWPEHFDTATAVEFQPGHKTNLGFSPGDSFCPEPYVYVGPWGSERPGDPGFWNAPFGALARRTDVPAAADCLEFLQRGMDVLAKG